jgi:hypothetical protein
MRLIRGFASAAGLGAFRLGLVDFEARPEPDPEQEEALTLALERLLAGEAMPRAYQSRWRAKGIAENVGEAVANAPTRESRTGE